MTKDEILVALQQEVSGYNKIIATDKGDWIVKGFIDIYKKIYTISIDTKVVSKVIELLLIPAFENFATKNDLILELPAEQNHYPDLTFITKKTNLKFAVDIKSTYKDKGNKIKSMTLGAFTGYFRNRETTKSTKYPYKDYSAHLVLGVLYSQAKVNPDEKKHYSIDELDQIESVIRNFEFFVQPKFKIASDLPGSGNTKNIGATKDIQKLLSGGGVFSKLGEEVYDDYWMNYLTADMALKAGTKRPYFNLESYWEHTKKAIDLFSGHTEDIERAVADASAEAAEDEETSAEEIPDENE